MIAQLLIAFLFSAHADDIREGGYLVRAAGCADCHTNQYDQPMAGGYRLETAFGAFYTPNLTPDVETGIGHWTEKMFLNALRFGISPSGMIYYPSFPYCSFTKITNADVHKIYLYLRTLAPIRKPNRPHELSFPYDQGWALYFWRKLYFKRAGDNFVENIKIAAGPFVPDPQMSPEWNRGAYLVEALAHCTECHTPRTSLGGLEPSQWMAGTSGTLGGKLIPNITPDPDTGLGLWSDEDWTRFLESGFTPQHRNPGHEMAEVIQNTSALTKADRAAMVRYLRSLKPVRHWLP